MSDYSSKDRPSTGQESRWLAPLAEWSTQGIVLSAVVQPLEGNQLLCDLLRELASKSPRIPKIGFGTWNYRGGVEPLRAAIEYGTSLIDTAEAYGTQEIVGKAIKSQRDPVSLATRVLPWNFRPRDVI